MLASAAWFSSLVVGSTPHWAGEAGRTSRGWNQRKRSRRVAHVAADRDWNQLCITCVLGFSLPDFLHQKLFAHWRINKANGWKEGLSVLKGPDGSNQQSAHQNSVSSFFIIIYSSTLFRLFIVVGRKDLGWDQRNEYLMSAPAPHAARPLPPLLSSLYQWRTSNAGLRRRAEQQLFPSIPLCFCDAAQIPSWSPSVDVCPCWAATDQRGRLKILLITRQLRCMTAESHSSKVALMETIYQSVHTAGASH